MTTEKKSRLDELSLAAIVRGIIFLKDGSPCFLEEALHYGLNHSEENYQRLKISEEELHNIVSFAQMGYFLELVDCQYLRKGPLAETAIDLFKKEYGKDILDNIKPLADKVWEEAAKYIG